jgi:ParB-like chromosome segregation protein Spo0J
MVNSSKLMSIFETWRISATPFYSEQDLQELASSIEKHGVMQPIVIRPVDDEQHP